MGCTPIQDCSRIVRVMLSSATIHDAADTGIHASARCKHISLLISVVLVKTL